MVVIQNSPVMLKIWSFSIIALPQTLQHVEGRMLCLFWRKTQQLIPLIFTQQLDMILTLAILSFFEILAKSHHQS
jgi:hypothetical protein